MEESGLIPAQDLMPGVSMIHDGKTLSKIETQYHTAISVQVPRDINLVLEKCVMEAQIAGELFYYSWMVKNKKTGKKESVEGLSIEAALTLARNWGNCACPMEVVEVAGEWIFRASFVDLEVGFTLSRIYRKTTPGDPGSYDLERFLDMAFQTAQSKAQRNVVLKGMPVWLRDRILEEAKQAALKGIGKMGLEVAKEKVVKFFLRYDVDKKRLVRYLDKTIDKWLPEDILTLRSAVQAIQNGDETVNSLFHEEIEDATQDATQDAIALFWKALEPHGLTPLFIDIVKYIQEVADFMGETDISVMARAGEGFYVDGQLQEKEVKTFLEQFRKRFPQKEAPPKASEPEPGPIAEPVAEPVIEIPEESPEPPPPTQEPSIEPDKKAGPPDPNEIRREWADRLTKKSSPYYPMQKIWLARLREMEVISGSETELSMIIDILNQDPEGTINDLKLWWKKQKTQEDGKLI